MMTDQLQTVSPSEVAALAKQAEVQFSLSPAGQMLKQFEVAQRAGQMYASSTIVPDTYKGNVANCAIACELAMRMGMPAMMVMQNLYVVYGNPAWSAKFLIACVNGCGRFTTLEYHEKSNVARDSDDWGVRCIAYEKGDVKRQRPLEGPWVTWKLVKAEGWFNKNGSKWKTMPDMMFRYRAAAMWQRSFAPDLAMGILTQEEVAEQHAAPAVVDVTPTEVTPAPALDAEPEAAPAPSPERIAQLKTWLLNCTTPDQVIGFRKTYMDEIAASDELRQAVIDRLDLVKQKPTTETPETPQA